MGEGRDDHESQGAHRVRMAQDAIRPGHLHVFPLCRQRALDPSRDRLGLCRHRLRDGAAAERRAAAADADERSGGADGRAGRREIPGAGEWRVGDAAGRGPRCDARPRLGVGRWCGGHQRRQDGGRPGGQGDDSRSRSESPPLSGGRHAGQRHLAPYQSARFTRTARRRGFGGGRGAPTRGESAQSHQAGGFGRDEAGVGDCGRVGRPGRLCGDQQTDDA